jgi:allantoicase
MDADLNIPIFADLAELASERVGGRAIATNDEFFASKSNLVKASAPEFIPGKYTSRGKWMDGWESRRRRTPGFDWCVVQLGMRGIVRGMNVNTAFFTGNYPTHCSVEALDTTKLITKGLAAKQGAPWIEIVPKRELRGDSDNFFRVKNDLPWTHLRLNIFPDGGVARLRVFGEVVVDWKKVARPGKPVDLAAIQNGGLVLTTSDMHYGAKDNIIMPGRAADMSDGWETKRRRGPGYDWVILRLGVPGRISRVEIDTNHFKGNYPDAASVEGCLAYAETVKDLSTADWTEVLPPTKLKPHRRHFFEKELRAVGVVSHVRLNIYPDGGVSRFRVYGTVGAD